jgi:hypothetical protein
VNVGTDPKLAPEPKVNEPAVSTKLVEGLIVPLEKLKAGPLTVKVVQVIVPILLKVPAGYVNELEQVKL